MLVGHKDEVEESRSRAAGVHAKDAQFINKMLIKQRKRSVEVVYKSEERAVLGRGPVVTCRYMPTLQ